MSVKKKIMANSTFISDPHCKSIPFTCRKMDLFHPALLDLFKIL